jgi:hypothetical protein
MPVHPPGGTGVPSLGLRAGAFEFGPPRKTIVLQTRDSRAMTNPDPSAVQSPLRRPDPGGAVPADSALPDAALPEPVRDHLGQQLRSVYNVESEKPQYLGDPALPPEFSPQLRRLESRLKAHETGTEAVEDALRAVLADVASHRRT